MAVKNTNEKVYDIAFDDMRELLRKPEVSKLLEAPFVEEAILPDGVEFRFKRKTDFAKYGRNYFVKLMQTGENKTTVAVTVQSRKITVLVDFNWKKEAQRVYDIIDVLASR